MLRWVHRKHPLQIGRAGREEDPVCPDELAVRRGQSDINKQLLGPQTVKDGGNIPGVVVPLEAVLPRVPHPLCAQTLEEKVGVMERNFVLYNTV